MFLTSYSIEIVIGVGEAYGGGQALSVLAVDVMEAKWIVHSRGGDGDVPWRGVVQVMMLMVVAVAVVAVVVVVSTAVEAVCGGGGGSQDPAKPRGRR